MDIRVTITTEVTDGQGGHRLTHATTTTKRLTLQPFRLKEPRTGIVGEDGMYANATADHLNDVLYALSTEDRP